MSTETGYDGKAAAHGAYAGPPVVGCPLCDDTHDPCVFAAGTLLCVTVDCRNPHHRRPVDTVRTKQGGAL
jgi:hypothetical protein